MFDIGFQEMVLIMVLALIVFGPSKLPELGKMVGRAMREFRRASEEFRSTVETNLKINEIDSDSRSDNADPSPGSFTGSGSTTPSASTDAVLAQAPVLDGGGPSVDSAAAAAEPEAGGDPYRAQRGSRLFHRRDCSWAARIAEEERVSFETVAQAKDQGYVTCPVCEPCEVGFAL